MMPDEMTNSFRQHTCSWLGLDKPVGELLKLVEQGPLDIDRVEADLAAEPLRRI